MGAILHLADSDKKILDNLDRRYLSLLDQIAQLMDGQAVEFHACLFAARISPR